MKAKIIMLFSVLMISGLIIFPACSDDNPTTGTLTVVILNFETGLPVAGEQVYLATSYEHLKTGVHYRNAWTNNLGVAYFGDLPPLIYYIDTQQWNDWIASHVYAGYDDYVVLYVNTPQGKKK